MGISFLEHLRGLRATLLRASSVTGVRMRGIWCSGMGEPLEIGVVGQVTGPGERQEE